MKKHHTQSLRTENLILKKINRWRKSVSQPDSHSVCLVVICHLQVVDGSVDEDTLLVSPGGRGHEGVWPRCEHRLIVLNFLEWQKTCTHERSSNLKKRKKNKKKENEFELVIFTFFVSTHPPDRTPRWLPGTYYVAVQYEVYWCYSFLIFFRHLFLRKNVSKLSHPAGLRDDRLRFSVDLEGLVSDVALNTGGRLIPLGETVPVLIIIPGHGQVVGVLIREVLLMLPVFFFNYSSE